MAITIVSPDNLQAVLERVWEHIDGVKANKIDATSWTWGVEMTVPRGTALVFDDVTTPVLTLTSGNVGSLYAEVAGQPDLYFGFWTNDGGEDTHLGLFRKNADGTAYVAVEDIYNTSDRWLSDTYITKYGFETPWNQSENVTDILSAVSGFNLTSDITIENSDVYDLLDVWEELYSVITAATTAANAYTDKKIEGIKFVEGDSVTAMTEEEVTAMLDSVFGSAA
jgi:hypothetical protein